MWLPSRSLWTSVGHLSHCPVQSAAGWEEKVAESREQQEAIWAPGTTWIFSFIPVLSPHNYDIAPLGEFQAYQGLPWPKSSKVELHRWKLKILEIRTKSKPRGLDDGGSAATALLHHSRLFKSSADDGHFSGLHGFGILLSFGSIWFYLCILFWVCPIHQQRKMWVAVRILDTTGVTLVKATVPSP